MEELKLSVTNEAQGWLDGGIAWCDRQVDRDSSCDDHAVMVVEFGPEGGRQREARCEDHGYWALLKDDVERVERPL